MKKVNQLDEEADPKEESEEDSEQRAYSFKVSGQKPSPLCVSMTVNNAPMQLEVLLKVKLDWSTLSLHHVGASASPKLQEVLERHSQMF